MRIERAILFLPLVLPLVLAACGSGEREPTQPVDPAARTGAVGGAFAGQQLTPSPFDVPGTVDRLRGAARARGLTVFATIDHQANAAAAGLTMRPETLLLLGNAAVGTPIMAGAPTAGIDLPLRVLVFQDVDGATKVLTNSVSGFARQHAIVGEDERLGQLNAAIVGITQAATRR